LHQPLGTVVGCGVKHALVGAFLAKHYTGVVGSSLERPIDTVTSVDHHSLVASTMVKLRGGLADHQLTAQDLRIPAPTLTAGGTHLAEVRAFLTKYYGRGTGAPLDDPMHAVTSHDTFGLVTVAGEKYAIADIGMRMLAPRELYRAQGFPDTYAIEIEHAGKPQSKTAQVRMCGNSVCPPMGAALVDANLVQPSPARAWFPPAHIKAGEQLSIFDLLDATPA
jgi:DNA (cytosine-5)-methyltransferase 1